ncbi:MAG: DCC1-like thiol-disulfide oxidoreductase family protein [Planctomycetota bacterium]
MTQTVEAIPQDAAAAEEHAVILFDGVCNMCNASVNYVIDHDPHARFRLAALQSDIGLALASEHGIDAGELSSIILVDSGKAYMRSSAVLRICRRLTGPAKLLWPFILVPTFLRDPFYRFVAKRRYKWFGKKDACRLPTPEDQARFL